MLNRFGKTTLALAAACTVGMAQADVLNFDDLTLGSNGVAFFLADYHGFTLGTNNIQTTAWFYTNDVNAYYGPHSGTNYVATDYQLYTGAQFEATQAISRATPFVFQGAWFSGGDQIRYQLYNGSTLVYTSADSPVITTAPIWVASGYSGNVTSVVIVGRQGYYAMDDFTYAPATTVPEPTSYGLMGAGLLAVGALVRRRRVG